eukprot:TRINITY_DN4560_c0_g1_i1.p1 TRINITY_DN4560_c0_g1~~TRINITY_DN4560_c0_g1_i1.p1  ORF type:complete len:187 (-),score=16.92 TRINITY_DN4560_c0_g1_i1:26-586(-)
MGGSILMLLSATFPEKVRSLSLIDTAGPTPSKEEDCPKLLRKAIESMERAYTRNKRLYKSIDDMVSRVLSVNAYLTQESAKCLVVRGSVQVEGGYHFSHDSRLVMDIPSRLRMSESQVCAFLVNIACPILIFWAEKDKRAFTLNEENASKRIELLKNAKRIFCKGGHHLHLDNPEIIIDNLVEFLQ